MGAEARLVFLVGKVRPRPRDMEMARVVLARHPGLDWDLVAALTVINKARGWVVPALRELGVAAEVREGFAAALERHSSRGEMVAHDRQRVRPVVARLLRLGAAAGVQLMAIKGSALAFLLPDYPGRHVRDLDLLTPDLESMWVFARACIEDGCVLEESENIWIQDFGPPGRPSRLEGHVTLRDAPGGVLIDLHSTSMTFGLTGILRAPLWERATPAELDGVPVLVPTAEDAWLVGLAHAANHGFFTLKDLNDAAELTGVGEGGGFDWDYLLDRLEADGLQGPAAYVLKALEERFGVSPPPRARWRLKHTGRWVRAFGRTERRTPRRGRLQACAWLLLNAWLASAGEGRRAGVAAAALWGARAAAKYLKDMWLGRDDLPGWLQDRLTRRDERPLLFPPPPYGRQVILTELDPALSARVRRLGGRAGEWEGALSAPPGAGGRPAAAGLKTRVGGGMLFLSQGPNEAVLNATGTFIPTRFMCFTQARLERLAGWLDGLVGGLERPG